MNKEVRWGNQECSTKSCITFIILYCTQTFIVVSIIQCNYLLLTDRINSSSYYVCITTSVVYLLQDKVNMNIRFEENFWKFLGCMILGQIHLIVLYVFKRWSHICSYWVVFAMENIFLKVLNAIIFPVIAKICPSPESCWYQIFISFTFYHYSHHAHRDSQVQNTLTNPLADITITWFLSFLSQFVSKLICSTQSALIGKYLCNEPCQFSDL